MKTGKEKAVICKLTPDAARKLLIHNILNRPLRNKLIHGLARAIKEGRWRLNGATIVMDTKSRMLDGQHRCHAIIRADKAAWVILVTGVDPKAFDTIDQGAKRTGSDIFGLCGVSNPSVVSASIAVVWQSRKGYPEGTAGEGRVPDMNERVALFDNLPGYEDMVKYVTRYRNQLCNIVPLPMMTGLYFLMQEQHKVAAQSFLTELAHGDCAEDHPARVLREKMEALNAEDFRIGRQARAAYVKTAWNAFAAGKGLAEIKLPQTLDIGIDRLSSRYWLDQAAQEVISS